MKLAFLGTGAAFSLERYNCAAVVDGRYLLDGGAPLLPHMHRLGIDPTGIRAIFVTHAHGDHILGLPPFVLYRAFNPTHIPLEIVGPAPVEGALERLFALAWGDEWPQYRDAACLSYQVADVSGEAAGIRYEAVELEHGTMVTRGYRLHLDGRILAYSGDTTATPPLDRLVEGADVAVTEATAPADSGVHTSWEQAASLARRHPNTRFFFNHLYAGHIEGDVSDLQVIDV